MNPQKKLFLNHLILSLLFSIIFIVVVIVSYQQHLLEKADFILYDLHFKWRGPQSTSGKIVLILMDQKSASELERKKGAWSRSQMAEALENLCKADTEIIGLDLVFFAPSQNQKEDAALAKAIESCGNVVLSKFVAVEGRREVTSLSMFQEGMIGDGFINMFPDRDGILRKTPFFDIKPVEEGVAISPSFSLEVARAFLNLDFALDFTHKAYFLLGAEGEKQLRLPYPDLRIHFQGREDVFKTLSYVDVVSGRFSPEDVKGKIVLIGSSLTTDKDFFPTPYSGYKSSRRSYEDKFGKVMDGDSGLKTVGVACHAHAVETILSDRFISKCPMHYVLFMIVICGFLGVIFYFEKPGPFPGFFLLVICTGAMIAGSHAVFIQNLLWVEIAPGISILAAQYVSGIAWQRAFSKKKTKLVTSLFGKYVSQGVVNDILRGDIGINLEGRSQEVTVLFSDLRKFTSISENLTPRETGHLLNTYFDTMIPIVFEYQGTLDKLMGDAIMAFFGAPRELSDHPQKAAETALKMVEELDRLKSESREKGIEKLSLGIGLNTGQVTVGNLGSHKFMDYTVIGDTVNLGSRLEGLNKNYGTSIIISQSTAEQLDSRFVLRELDRVRVKGKAHAVTIFELLGVREELDESHFKFLEIFHSGRRRYIKRDWKAAEETFNQALELFPEDRPTRLYLERVEDLLKNPPDSDWDPTADFFLK